ncbi:hypothetical protein Pcac1_g11508 [Phytophthora cactorum]|nr:hypothetical protein Pcac1_g11508 [Phytophthora cactorum]
MMFPPAKLLTLEVSTVELSFKLGAAERWTKWTRSWSAKLQFKLRPSFNVDYDDEKATYPLSKNLATALQAPLKSKCGLWMFTAHNEFLPGENNPLVPDPMVNFALREAHLWLQHIRKMDDEGLVEGVMLRRRQLNMCEACQIGKQRAKAGGAQ